LSTRRRRFLRVCVCLTATYGHGTTNGHCAVGRRCRGERPASWCDGHHLVHWIDGGETELKNMVLLCRRHHRMVHEGEWQIVKTEERFLPIAPSFFSPWLPRGPD
jgi:hypothetical protein